MKSRILLLGLGFELELVLKHLLNNLSVDRKFLSFTRRDENKIKSLSKLYKIAGYSGNIEAIEKWKPEIIFVGVKPQELSSVLNDIRESKFQNFKEIIFITASLPFGVIEEFFPGKYIANIIPDDSIDIKHPSNIVNYCSNRRENNTIEKVFRITCKKLIRIDPKEMVEFTALACQGNPILNLFILEYEYSNKITSFSDFIVDRFQNLITALNGDILLENELTKLANGYKRALETIHLRKELGLEILLLTFQAMIDKKESYKSDSNELKTLISNWATVGGYEERGIEVVKEMYLESTYTNYAKLSENLIYSMVKRGKQINTKLSKELGSLL